MDGVFKTLEEASGKLCKWFSDYLMKSYADKFHLLASTNSAVSIRVENFNTKNGHCEKLLGVKFDCKLTFNSHIILIWKS